MGFDNPCCASKEKQGLAKLCATEGSIYLIVYTRIVCIEPAH